MQSVNCASAYFFLNLQTKKGSKEEMTLQTLIY